MPFARLCVVIAALLAVATPALADPAAEQLFRDGKQLLKDGHVDEACDRFEKSEALEARSGTLLNLGDCRERQGNFASAWEMFLQAKALASRENNPQRADTAAKRAAAIAPRRAFITYVVPAERRVPGLVITRNDIEVPPAVWDTEVPIDPGRYVIVAKAPGFEPQTTNVEVARESKATATVPASRLTASPRGAIEPPVADHLVRHDDPIPPVAVWPPLATVGFGPLIGMSSDGDFIVGGRLVGGIALPSAALRGSFSVKYAQFLNGLNVPNNTTDLFAFGVALDYVRLFHRGLGAAGGVGAGIDRLEPASENTATTSRWFSLRATPVILRFGTPRLELAATVELVLPSKTVLGLIGLDWFVW